MSDLDPHNTVKAFVYLKKSLLFIANSYNICSCNMQLQIRNRKHFSNQINQLLLMM